MSVNPLRTIVLAAGRVVRAVSGARALAAASFSELVINDLGREFDGYTIVALADLHHSPGFELGWLAHAVDTATAVSPDLVVMLGDYGESFRRMRAESARWYAGALPEMTGQLSRLRATDGVVAVLGNHDYYAGASMVTDWLRSISADVLVNRCRCITRANGTLRVAGLDDVRQGTVDPLVGCSTADSVPTIVLSHNPDGVLHLDPRLRVDALLAGHTHGGQIVVPGFGAPVRMARVCGRRSASGWIQHHRTPVYVTRGLGEQLPVPLRFNCPPEILVLRLRSGNQQPA